MNKILSNYKNKIGILLISTVSLLSCNQDPNEHNNYIPGGTLPKPYRIMVNNLQDSTLKSRIKTYCMYRSDFRNSTILLNDNFESHSSRMYSDFNVFPLFTDSIKTKYNNAIKTPYDYNSFLNDYETDSIEALYIKLYKEKIMPELRKKAQKVK